MGTAMSSQKKQNTSHENAHVDDTFDVKLVLVGDSRSGKTALAQRFVSDQFAEIYTPTSFEKYATSYRLTDCTVNFDIWDTSGSNSYNNVRPLAYQDAKAFLLCFSVNEHQSLENALNKWHPEIKKHSPNIPIILCGCQSDVRVEKIAVTSEEALEVSRQISAVTYIELSSKIPDTAVCDAFEIAALAAIGKLNKKQTLKMYSKTTAVKHKHKISIKNDIKSRAKSCTMM